MNWLLTLAFFLVHAISFPQMDVKFPGGVPLSSPSGYGYERTITIKHSLVGSSNSLNLPVLISGTYAYLATTGNGGRVVSSSGYDIIFSSFSGCPTTLKWQQESWNATTGAVIYWVQVPVVSSSADTTIYMCYGNSSISSFQGGATGAAWDSYFKGIWHLGNGVTLSAADSTTTANAGTKNGSTPPGATSSGEIDGAATFNGSTAFISTTNLAGITASTPFTLSAWVYPTSDTDSPMIMDTEPQNVPTDGVWLQWNSSGEPTFGIGTTSGNAEGITVASALSLSNWYYLVATYDGSQTLAGMNIYVNGSAVSTTTQANSGFGTFTDRTFYIGTDHFAGALNYFPGTLDEVRFSVGTARSADWITAEFNNQSSPSTFYVVGNELPL